MDLHPIVAQVTARIRERSTATRRAYLDRTAAARQQGSARLRVPCANFAHSFASTDGVDKRELRAGRWPNIAIVSAYNDILSAHQPLQRFPAIIKQAAREAFAVAQFAGGVPAMCDGVTQGEPGMEIGLFSRDVIAMSTAVALSHNVFDAALCLGICDKIVPGLLIGALSFGHLPVIFVPGGPMTSGLSNDEKSRIRQLSAQGKVGRDALLDAESKAYHGPGTCTFYGTANSNQMLMELMGLHLPGAAFVHPYSQLRDALTAEAARRVAAMTMLGKDYTPLAEVVDERAIVNAIVGLHATGGSPTPTIPPPAPARAAVDTFRRDVNGRRLLARCAGHPPGGHQGHFESFVLQAAEQRRQLVQLRHAVGSRSLEAHDGHEITLQLAAFERLLHGLLAVEHDCRRLDAAVRALDCGDFDHGAAQIAGQQSQAAIRIEGLGNGTQHIGIQTLRRCIAPLQGVPFEVRLSGIRIQALAGHRFDIAMQQTGGQQLADQEAHSAGRVKLVHVRLAIGINPAQQGDRR